MVVLVDVDGVVADFVGECARIADVATSSITNYEFCRGLTPEQEFSVRAAMERQEFWTGLPVIPFAQEGIAKWLRGGHDVVWCTKPYTPCVGWADARAWWLRMHFPDVPSENLIMTARKELCEGHYLIDDCHDNVRQWSEFRPGGVLYAAPYNKGTFTWQRFIEGGGLLV